MLNLKLEVKTVKALMELYQQQNYMCRPSCSCRAVGTH